MTDKPKKTVFPSWSFSLTSQPTNHVPKVDASIEKTLKDRNQSFFGAVFNALDDYLRRGHAYGLPDSAISTDFLIDQEGAFCISMIPAPYNDQFQDRPQEAVQGFCMEIFDVAALHEMEGLTHGHSATLQGDRVEYILKFDNKYEVMQLIEHMLKPYDIGESLLPSFQDVSENEKKSVPFSLFSQYSLRHIRAMFMMTQGRSSEVAGIHMNH